MVLPAALISALLHWKASVFGHHLDSLSIYISRHGQLTASPLPLWQNKLNCSLNAFQRDGNFYQLKRGGGAGGCCSAGIALSTGIQNAEDSLSFNCLSFCFSMSNFYNEKYTKWRKLEKLQILNFIFFFHPLFPLLSSDISILMEWEDFLIIFESSARLEVNKILAVIMRLNEDETIGVCRLWK